MTIQLTNIAKKYRREWIFKKVDYTFEAGKKYAIAGHNGSGKSTLTGVLTGFLTPTKGKITYTENGEKVNIDEVYSRLAIAAPYVDLIEEFTLREAVHFHKQFKPLTAGIDEKELLELLNLQGSEDKEIRNFSSGMKQRLKLALAICSDVPLVFLDEPTTNLDRAGVAWYLDLIKNYEKGKTMIIASNVAEDFDFCDARLDITNYK